MAFSRSLKAMDDFLGQIRQLASSKEVEARQVTSLCQSLEKKCKITTEDGASMLACLNNCKHVSEEARQSLMKAIIAKTSSEMIESGEDLNEENSVQRKLQDYTGLCSFLSPQVWKLIMEPSRPACDALSLICQWAAVLGLAQPSEGTMGVLTAIANYKSWCSFSVSNAAKYKVLQSYKKPIREHLVFFNKQLSKRSPRLQRLPATFDDLPECLKEHFANEPLGNDIFFAHFFGSRCFSFFFTVSTKQASRQPVPVDQK